MAVAFGNLSRNVCCEKNHGEKKNEIERKRINCKKKLSRQERNEDYEKWHIQRPENRFEPFRQAVTLKLKKNTEMNDHKHLTHCECGVHIHTTDLRTLRTSYRIV